MRARVPHALRRLRPSHAYALIRPVLTFGPTYARFRWILLVVNLVTAHVSSPFLPPFQRLTVVSLSHSLIPSLCLSPHLPRAPHCLFTINH